MDIRTELDRLLGVYDRNRATNACKGENNEQMIRDCFLDDLVGMFKDEPSAPCRCEPGDIFPCRECAVTR